MGAAPCGGRGFKGRARVRGQQAPPAADGILGFGAGLGGLCLGAPLMTVCDAACGRGRVREPGVAIGGGGFNRARPTNAAGNAPAQHARPTQRAQHQQSKPHQRDGPSTGAGTGTTQSTAIRSILGWWKIEGPPGGGEGLETPKIQGGGLGKGAPRAARPIPHEVCPRRGPRAREVSERLYIHHPGKEGVHKGAPVAADPWSTPFQRGGGLEKGLQAPPPPGAFQFSPSLVSEFVYLGATWRPTS